MSTQDDHPPSSITEADDHSHEDQPQQESTPEPTPQQQEEQQSDAPTPQQQPGEPQPQPMNRGDGGQQQQQQPPQLQLPKELAEMFSRLAETMVFAIAPPDGQVERIVNICTALEVSPQTLTVDQYVSLFNEANSINRILRAYRHRSKLYTLEERVLLNAANMIMAQWREDVTAALVRSQAQNNARQ